MRLNKKRKIKTRINKIGSPRAKFWNNLQKIQSDLKPLIFEVEKTGQILDG